MSGMAAITLSPSSHQLLSQLAQRGLNLFTSREARNILGRTPTATNKLLHTLVRQGYVQRLEKGKFLLIPLTAAATGEGTAAHEFVLAMQLVQPSYIAYGTALAYHSLTEQLANVVFVATPKRKKAVKIHGVTFHFVTLAKIKFFGIETVPIDDQSFRISDPEKTLVDCFAHPEYCGGLIEAARGLWNGIRENRLDLNKLTRYAERLGNRAVLKRIGYLVEFYHLPVDGHVTRWRARLSAGYNPLDPLGRRSGQYNARWQLLINRSPAELNDWRVH
jgi:predicted transcriptional regulator of viral defense system